MPWLALLVACGPGPDPSGSAPALRTTEEEEPIRAPGFETPGVRPAPHATPEALGGARTAPFPNVDVLVIGAGPAGLAAALEAWRSGASVAVLERETDFGGSANWAGALMLFSGTAEQAALGVSDSPEQLLAEWPSFTGGDAGDPWVQAFAHRNVPDVYDWLKTLGVTFTGPGQDSSSGETRRVLSVV
ncbi:MAG: FAD-dependent oxidoreductase, partial [Myxococcota bacterium]